MKRALFSDNSVYSVIASRAEQAADAVKKIDRQAMMQPDLGGKLQAIVAAHTPHVAELHKPTGGEARLDRQPGSNGYGDHFEREVSLLDVRIPFIGDRNSFSIVPTRSTVKIIDCEIADKEFVLTVPHDGKAEQHIDAFMRYANEMLGAVRVEVEQSKSKIADAVKSAADKRRALIAAENERDSKLSFPVQR